jgi:DNA mismatch endonuclease (patch repair protein)
MYSRDKRSPTPKNEAVSRVMSANRANQTPLLPEEGWMRFVDGVVGVPELTLRKALYKAGLRGYRLHRRVSTASDGCGPTTTLAGSDARTDRGSSSTRHSSLTTHHSAVRPDISYVGKKLAIFVHGCFWHRCPKCSYKLPKTNSAFWQAKFDRNVARDARKAEDLRNIGWTVLTVWECDLKEDLPGVVLG